MCYPSSSTHYGCINSCGIAFPSTCLANREETVIEISLDPQYTQKPSISALAQGVLQSLTQELRDSEYFPENAARFTQLIYYAGLTDEQSPYSERDYTILKRAYNSDLSTKRWLQIGFVSAIGTPLALWAINSQNPWVIASAITINVASNAISWISTGSNPDFKSDSANARQDTLQKFSSSLEDMARELIDLTDSHPSLAEEIATSLDLEHISKKIREQDPSNSQPSEILRPLRAAKEYVLNSYLPMETPLSIRSYAKLAEISKSNS
jgi:hypothetical protein